MDGRGPGAPSALIRVRKLEKRILQRRLLRCFYGILFVFVKNVKKYRFYLIYLLVFAIFME